MSRRLHWKRECEELVRLADPGAEGPIYLVSASQAAAVFDPDPDTLGFTGLLLCHQLRRAIGRRWQGPGFCAVINIETAATRVQRLAVALHEYAHHCAGRRDSQLKMIAACRMERLCVPRRKPGQPLRKRRIEPCQPGEYDKKHGPAFYRMAAHLAHRSWRFWGGHFVEVVGPSRQSQLSDPLAYRAALGDEPARRAGEPLAAIAASNPPAGFAALAREDAARVERHFARNDKEG